jgi:uncharacterized membrane protein
MGTLNRHVRRRLLAGFLVVLPLLVCIWVVSWIFSIFDRALTLRLLTALDLARLESPWVVWVVRVAALLALLTLLYLLGSLATNVFGRRMLRRSEQAIGRLPLLGGFYAAVRQVVDAFSGQGGTVFQKVVLIEYPRRGVWTLAFVSNEQIRRVGRPPVGCVSVFVPTTPNPTSGFFLMVPADQCYEVDFTIEEAIKIIVSGGAIGPQKILPSQTAAEAAREPADPPGQG